jgi:hypothetical protein
MNKQKHVILELPEQAAELDQMISNQAHDITNIGFSSVVVDGTVKHFALVIWHDFIYGEHAP